MKFLCILFFCCIGRLAYTQQLEGRVWEENAGVKNVLPGANGYWVGSTDGATTDQEGQFRIEKRVGAILVVSFTGNLSDKLTVRAEYKCVEGVLKNWQELDGVK